MTSKETRPADRFAPLVKQAEEAVAAVKDPELRRVAFDKIMDALLAQEAAVSPGSRRPRGGGKADSTTHDATAQRKPTKRRGPKGYVEDMIADGFFRTQRTIAQVQAELGNRGHHIAQTSLSGPLQSLCKARKLRRQKKLHGKKQIYVYSNW